MYVSCQSLHFVVVVVLARRAVLDAQAQSSCDLSPGLSTISTGHHHQLVRFFMHHSSPPFGHKVHQCVAVPHIHTCLSSMPASCRIASSLPLASSTALSIRPRNSASLSPSETMFSCLRRPRPCLKVTRRFSTASCTLFRSRRQDS